MKRHLGTTTSALTLAIAGMTLVLALASASLAQPGSSSEAARTIRELGTANLNDPIPDPVPLNILDQADEDVFLSLLGWSSKYRIGLDVQDGDWVKYESVGDAPKEILELRAKKTDNGETWLIEKRTAAGSNQSTELHALFSRGKPKLLQAFRILEDGTRQDITPLDDIRSGEIFLDVRKDALDTLGGEKNCRVRDCGGDVQELTGPYGKLLCRCVEVQVAEDVDPVSFATRRRWLSEGNLVWLNEDVPRLIPMSAVLLPSILSPDDMMSVPGGMVRSAFHVLVDYKGRD
jgi:hypothetical protein